MTLLVLEVTGDNTAAAETSFTLSDRLSFGAATLRAIELHAPGSELVQDWTKVQTGDTAGGTRADGNAAIARYEQRRVSDAQAPVGTTEFDDSGEEDQELGEFDGVTGGAHDAERRALRVAKNDLAHRRRILTRFDTWEDDSWLDPDRSGPPNSNLNQLYDDTDLVDDAEERLMAARAEHAEMGDNALVGSQLSEMLAGQGGAPTITAY